MGTNVPTTDDYTGLNIISAEDDVQVIGLKIDGGGILSTALEIVGGNVVMGNASKLTITPVGTQTMGVADTVDSGALYQPIISTGNVVSDLTTTITDGLTAGQLLIIANVDSGETITLDANAKTFLSGGTSVVMGEGDAIMLIWDGAQWLHLATGANAGA